MPRKKASVRWCNSGNDRRRLRHFAFSLPLLSFPLSLLSFFPFPFFARSAPSRILLPDFSHTLPVFSVFPPRFCWFTALFLSFPLVVSTRLFIARKTHSANPADAHELSPQFHPIFCTIHMAENGAAIWNIPTIYVYLPSHSQKANTSSHPRVRNASQI